MITEEHRAKREQARDLVYRLMDGEPFDVACAAVGANPATCNRQVIEDFAARMARIPKRKWGIPVER